MSVLAASAIATSNHTLLTVAAVLGIGTVVLLITWAKLHPFLALILGSVVLGLVAGVTPDAIVKSFTTGLSTTFGAVGLLVALGAMIGGLLADSGGADRVVTTVVEKVRPKRLPWAMAGVAALIGIPLFFEVGVVLLVPIVLLVARRSGLPLVKVGIPALAGLSVLHGFVPPHPGPLAAIANLKADLGLTLLFGLVVAIPAVVLAGPVYGTFIARYVTAQGRSDLVPVRGREPVSTGARSGQDDPPRAGDAAAASAEPGADRPRAADRPAAAARTTGGPGFAVTVLTILVPVALMLLRAIGELTLDAGTRLRTALDTVGNPPVALLAGVLLAMFTLGYGTRMTRQDVSGSLGRALPPIAGILLIVAAGGGFKQLLVDAGVAKLISDAASGSHLSPLVLGWLVAVGIRLATGSATVATITAAGIVAPLAATLDRPVLSLLALAVGAGSLFFSHVNDAGFWLVKEYFGMSVGDTIRTWSIMETIISVVGLIGVLLLNLVV